MVDYSEKLTIVSKTACKVYVGKKCLVNFNSSRRLHKTQNEAQRYARQTEQQCRDQRRQCECQGQKRYHIIEKTKRAETREPEDTL